jgi:hypothetical protein
MSQTPNNTDDTMQSETTKATAGEQPDCRSVEDYWHHSLTTRGVDPEAAERVIRSVHSHPVLASGDPSKDEIEKLTREGIEAADLAREGIDNPEQVRKEMREALLEGLAGKLLGPLSLTTPYDVQAASDPPVNKSGIESADSSFADQSSEDTDSATDIADDGHNEHGTLDEQTADERASSTPVDNANTDVMEVDLDDARAALGMDLGGANDNQSAGVLAADADAANAVENDAHEGEHETLDEIREEHGRDEAESDDGPAIPEAEIQSIVTDSLGVSECYTVALRDLIKSENPGDVTGLLEKAWTQRDQTEADQERRDTAAAGVLLSAHAELGLGKEKSPNRNRLAEAVNQWREELPEAVLAVHEAIEDGERTTEVEHLQASVDTDKFTREDLETLIFSQIVDEIERSISDVYTTALGSVLDKEPADAVQAFSYAWQNRSDALDEDEHRDGIAAGVGLLAHVSLDLIDEDRIDETAVIEEVAINQQALGDAVVAVYEEAVDRTPSSSPAELRETVGSQRDQYNRAELETLAMADLLELMQNNSPGEQADSVVETYAAALYSIAEDEPERALQKLEQAWNGRTDTEKEGRTAGVAAGVALLAHAELGVQLTVPDREMLAEEMETYRPELSDAVTAVYDTCTGQSVALSPEELIQQADTEDPGVKDLESLVFARLLNTLADNSG